MNTSIPLTDRDVRQRDLVPPERLAACHGLVIGVGAVGRQVALQLAAVGVPRMTLYDDDDVQVENLAPQGYFADDLGKRKVYVTASLCRRIHPGMEIMACEERFKRSTAKSHPLENTLAVFACVDSIVTRRLLWEALRSRASLFVDGRMSAEVIRVLAVESPGVDRYYATTLFGADEAHAGACTAKSTIYTASIAAGLMVSQWTKWLRRLPIDQDLCLNLLSAELTATGEVAVA
jgi:hypothetical protein